ncbi:major facilitator superfamily transporter [Colletotrichum salicis]|uniref:Major facilitator superfamily transporter n=1 Tax=Colletotrichum salicis TaxID=1209931 RepID=A0A135V748_9PEZI|nr:major facilitator superfamily transporter [Colletotrichum salicis]
MSSALKESVPRDKWWEWKWFSPDDTKEERRLITKIDLLLVSYPVLGYWVKYVDQFNLNNAYVAGMKEGLGCYGNELVQLQTLFTLGSVLGQIPFLFIMIYVPIQYLIPICDVLWGVFTLLQYCVHSYAELAAYRFMVGWFEAAFFPEMHYVFGHEIARRGGIFYTGLAAGTLTAGLIRAGASSSLEGVHGMEGWRWMYIICALITIPVGIFGFYVIPGTIDQPNRWCVNDKDIETARERLEKHGHVLHGKMKFGHIKRTLLGFCFWLVITTATSSSGPRGTELYVDSHQLAVAELDGVDAFTHVPYGGVAEMQEGLLVLPGMRSRVDYVHLERDKKDDTGSTDEETSGHSEVGEESAVGVQTKSNLDAKEHDSAAAKVERETGDDKITAI